jgi:hypothetical protein
MKISPRIAVLLFVSMAAPSSAVAKPPKAANPPADRPLTRFESSLVGRWYAGGDVNKVAYIASAGSMLFTINEYKDTMELSASDDGSIAARHFADRLSGVVSGNFLMWSNASWWSREPVDFSRKESGMDNDQRGAVKVLSASYGTDNKFSDVTNTVAGLLKDGGEHYANPGELRADPNPGWNKALVIIYVYRGERRLACVVENNPFSMAMLKAPR